MMSEKVNQWIVTVIQDPESEDLMIELPPDLCESAGWDIGDTINWKLSEKGYAILTKVNIDESPNS